MSTGTQTPSFKCDACARQFRWKPELAGRRVKCPCGAVAQVPAQPPGGTAAAAEPAAPRPAARPPVVGAAPVPRGTPAARPIAKPPVARPASASPPVPKVPAAAARRAAAPTGLPPIPAGLPPIPTAGAAAAAPRRQPPPPPPPQDDAGFDFNDLAALEAEGKPSATPPQAYGAYPAIPPVPAAAAGQTVYRPTPEMKPAKASGSGGGGLFARFAPANAKVSGWELTKFWGYTAGCLVAGIGVLVVCYALSAKHAAFMAVAKQSAGTIEGRPEVTKSGRRTARLNSDNWTFKFPVRYTVDGRERREEVSCKGDSLPPDLDPDDTSDWAGHKMTVYYDPADPTNVQAGGTAENKNFLWGYLVGVGLIGSSGWTAFRKWPY